MKPSPAPTIYTEDTAPIRYVRKRKCKLLRVSSHLNKATVQYEDGTYETLAIGLLRKSI